MRSAFTHWLARRVAGFPTLVVSLTPRASAYRSVAIADSRAREGERTGEKLRESSLFFQGIAVKWPPAGRVCTLDPSIQLETRWESRSRGAKERKARRQRFAARNVRWIARGVFFRRHEIARDAVQFVRLQELCRCTSVNPIINLEHLWRMTDYERFMYNCSGTINNVGLM